MRKLIDVLAARSMDRVIAAPGVARTMPVCRAVPSSRARIVSASAARPWRASHSGLSGTISRRTQITMLAAAPISTTQRQPSIP